MEMTMFTILTLRCCCALLSVVLGLSSAFAASVPVAADTYTSTGFPSNNFGALPNLNVGGGNTGLIRFDVAGALPAGTTGTQIAKATLYLWVNKINSAGAIDVSTASSAWNEFSVNQNTVPRPALAVGTGVPVPSADVWVTVDGTSAVKGWVDSPASNNGFLLAAGASSLSTFIILDSKENTSTSKAAFLDISLISSGVQTLFGSNTNHAVPGNGQTCTVGEILLSAGRVAVGIPANGQLLQISQNFPLFTLLGTMYGGDGQNTFALPDLRAAAPNGLTYSICDQGIFPTER